MCQGQLWTWLYRRKYSGYINFLMHFKSKFTTDQNDPSMIYFLIIAGKSNPWDFKIWLEKTKIIPIYFGWECIKFFNLDLKNLPFRREKNFHVHDN